MLVVEVVVLLCLCVCLSLSGGSVLMQTLVKELQSGKLPLVRANGPFGCAAGHKWGGHQVMVIFAGGIGVSLPAPLCLCATATDIMRDLITS